MLMLNYSSITLACRGERQLEAAAAGDDFKGDGVQLKHAPVCVCVCLCVCVCVCV